MCESLFFFFFLWPKKRKRFIPIPAFQVGLCPACVPHTQGAVRASCAAHSPEPSPEMTQGIQILQQLQAHPPFAGELSLPRGRRQLGKPIVQIRTNGRPVPASEGERKISRLAGHSHQDPALPSFHERRMTPLGLVYHSAS